MLFAREIYEVAEEYGIAVSSSARKNFIKMPNAWRWLREKESQTSLLLQRHSL
jgi:tetrahydromethanopterin S-methyltransferase subunit H